MRRQCQRDGMRRLRAWFAATLPGGLGTPPYRHYDRCAGSLLDHRSEGIAPGGKRGPGSVRQAPAFAPKRRDGALSGARPAFRTTAPKGVD